MILNQNSSMNVVLHEFGHVLGLRDEYYTQWNEENCSYSEQYNMASIMSSSQAGKILKSHTDELKKFYFNN